MAVYVRHTYILEKSKQIGYLAQEEFLNYSARATRYGLFSPMEASIIFHFAGRGDGGQRLALLDFGHLLDPRWQPPLESIQPQKVSRSLLETVGQSAYSFLLGAYSDGSQGSIFN